MRVRWDDLDPQKYEDAVAVLLSRLNPMIQRIDGRGGDGGRDAQFRSDDGLTVYELKSFAGRVNKSRKQQVQASLKNAAKLKPAVWVLVMPIDPTPTELQWFADLQASVDFPLRWHGRTWLDAMMAEHPSVERYFFEDARDEVLRLISELQVDVALPQTAFDVVLPRVQAIQNRLREIDPYYRYEFATGVSADAPSPQGSVLNVLDGDVRISAIPAFVGATEERPIRAKMQIEVPASNTELIQQIKSAFDYGTAVNVPPEMLKEFTIDAPSGLGGNFAGGKLEIGPALVEQDPIQGVIATSLNGRTLATLGVDIRIHSRGHVGSVFAITEASGILSCQMFVNPIAKSGSVTISTAFRRGLPSSILPVFRWLETLKCGSIIEVRFLGAVFSATVPRGVPLVDAGILELIDALAEIQAKTHTYFDMPDSLTGVEAQRIVHARKLLSGELVKSTWSGIEPLEIELTDPELIHRFEGENGTRLRLTHERTLEIAGHGITLGTAETTIHSARLAEAVRRISPDGTFVGLSLTPGISNLVTERLLFEG